MIWLASASSMAYGTAPALCASRMASRLSSLIATAWGERRMINSPTSD